MSSITRRLAPVLGIVLLVAVGLAVAHANTPSPSIASRKTTDPQRATQRGLTIDATELWRVALPVEIVGLPSADADGIVVTAGDSQVLSVSTTGQTQWSTAVAGALAHKPRLDRELVFVAATRAVVALRRATGEVLWSVPTTSDTDADDRANRPVVSGDTVVVTTQSGEVVGLDRTTGAARWSLRLPTASTAEPALVAGIVAVVGIGEWYGVDAASGAVRWSSELGLFGTSSPVTYDDGGVPLAAVASDEHLVAVEALTGQIVWRVPAEQSELYQVPHLDASHNLLVADHWGRVTAFDAHSGERLWATAGDEAIAEFGEPVGLAHKVVAMSLDTDGPRFASIDGATTLALPADGHGVVGFGDSGIVVSTWGGAENYLVAYRLDIGT